jgi:hypothetical protein
LEQQEAVILDVRGMDLPEWIFPYVYGRLVPTIKLARLEPNEVISIVRLPPSWRGSGWILASPVSSRLRTGATRTI